MNPSCPVYLHACRLIQRPSPSCVLSFVITAGLRGELGKAWSWNDGSGDQTNKETDISRSADLQGVETEVVEENPNASIINE